MTIINVYFLPSIFSVMAFLSLNVSIKITKTVWKIMVSFAVSFFVMFIYFFIHAIFDGIPIMHAFFLFDFTDLLASFGISVINLIALWILVNFKKDEI